LQRRNSYLRTADLEGIDHQLNNKKTAIENKKSEATN
jgi:hypothetical protein